MAEVASTSGGALTGPDSARCPDGHRRAGGLPKSRRIRRRVEFAAVQREGKPVRAEHATLLVWRRDDALPARLGIVASRKIGGAVVRNRLKRRIREWFRRQELPAGLDFVVIPRPSAAQATSADFRTSLDAAAAKVAHTLRR